jgi:Ca2+-binding RTX toxin-like protein
VLDVYALGVGVGSGSGPQKALLAVAGGDASHVVNINDYAALEHTLLGMVPFEAHNIFDMMSTADVSSIVGVTVNGVLYGMLSAVDPQTGLRHTGPITLPNGSVIDFYENGDYVLRANDLSGDFDVTVKFDLRDADGDTHSTDNMTLVIKDHLPVAYDNVSYMTDEVQHTPAQLLGNFHTTDWQHEGWISTTDVRWNQNTTAAARPGAYPAALASRVQAEYGVNLNSGAYANDNYSVVLTAEARTPQQVSLIADWDTMTNFVKSASGGDVQVVAYTGNKPDITVTATSVVSRGGEIVVSWGHYGHAAANGNERDGAFALLLDENGNIVSSGFYVKPLPGSGTATSTETGFWTLTVPDTGFERAYKLVVAAFDGGNGKANSSVDSILYVDTITQLNHDFSGPSHSGNLIKDRGVDGLVDEAGDEARIGLVTYNGVDYYFQPGEHVKTIPMDEGTLYIGVDGEYFFKPSSPNGTFSGAEFTYRLVDRDGDWSEPAAVRLAAMGESSPAPVAYDDAAHTEVVGTGNSAVSVLTGNVLTDKGMGGSVDYASEAAIVTTVIYNGVEYALGSSGLVNITTSDGGTLHVQSDGVYAYIPAPGHTPAGMHDRFEYVVSEGGNTSSATVHLYSDDMRTAGTAGDNAIDLSGMTTPILVEAGAGNDTVLGGTGDDVLDGGTGNDVISGGAGNDTVYGGAGNDTISGGAGDDVIHGGPGNDVIGGGAGDDLIYGGAGNDVIDGGSGNDVIYGGSGNDTIYGGAGNDLLIVEPGHGSTEFLWKGEDLGGFHDIIRGFEVGNDIINLSDIIGDPAEIGSLIDSAAWNSGTNTLTVTGTYGSLTAGVSNDNTLVLTLTSGGEAQTITIEAASSNAFASFNNNQDAAVELLKHLIKEG